MCTPGSWMDDLPDHCPIPVDAAGDGPADTADTVGYVCWTCHTPWERCRRGTDPWGGGNLTRCGDPNCRCADLPAKTAG